MVSVENHIGKITVSERYLTELVRHTVTGCFGVADIASVSTAQSVISAATGGKFFGDNKGVYIHSSKNNGLVIDLHIKVTYGTNITAAVNSIIHKVSFTVEEAAGVSVNNVNVYVDGMIY
ncbi:MAG: Asp23/Gls24 family envelope stress response protein [Ruminococcus sp.]|nr:Asp23/Gls24 family envelope stress response protein [Oscillospiraceae bacterium]